MTTVPSPNVGIVKSTFHESAVGDTSISVTSRTTLSATREVTARIRLIGAAPASAAEGINAGWIMRLASPPVVSVGESLLVHEEMPNMSARRAEAERTGSRLDEGIIARRLYPLSRPRRFGAGSRRAHPEPLRLTMGSDIFHSSRW